MTGMTHYLISSLKTSLIFQFEKTCDFLESQLGPYQSLILLIYFHLHRFHWATMTHSSFTPSWSSSDFCWVRYACNCRSCWTVDSLINPTLSSSTRSFGLWGRTFFGFVILSHRFHCLRFSVGSTWLSLPLRESWPTQSYQVLPSLVETACATSESSEWCWANR